MAVSSIGMGISLAITAATTAMQAMQASAAGEAADAEAEASYKSAKANAKSIRESYVNAIGTIDEQNKQMNRQAVEKQNILKRQTDDAMASLRVAAGGAGIRGNTPNQIINLPQFAQAHDSALIEQNRVYALAQSDLNKRDLRAKAQSGLNVAQSTVRPGNNWGATGLQIGGSILSGLGQAINTGYSLGGNTAPTS